MRNHSVRLICRSARVRAYFVCKQYRAMPTWKSVCLPANCAYCQSHALCSTPFRKPCNYVCAVCVPVSMQRGQRGFLITSFNNMHNKCSHIPTFKGQIKIILASKPSEIVVAYLSWICFFYKGLANYFFFENISSPGNRVHDIFMYLIYNCNIKNIYCS